MSWGTGVSETRGLWRKRGYSRTIGDMNRTILGIWRRVHFHRLDCGDCLMIVKIQGICARDSFSPVVMAE